MVKARASQAMVFVLSGVTVKVAKCAVLALNVASEPTAVSHGHQQSPLLLRVFPTSSAAVLSLGMLEIILGQNNKTHGMLV
jgi:hypothetical protein